MLDAFAPVAGQLELVAGRALTVAESTTFMTAAMALAEATGKPLGETTAALAKVMQAYGLGVDKAANASDILFNVSRALNLPISDVADAVDKLHGKLGIAAPSLADTGALVEALASHGISGSRGLLTVSGAMIALLDPAKKVSKEVQALGLTIYDSNGKFVGMESIIGQLQPKLAGMTDQQRIATLTSLFGSKAAEVMNGVIADGSKKFEEHALAIGKSNSATDAAAKATDTAKGHFEKAKTAVIDMAIGIGQKLLPVVEVLIGALSTVVGWLTRHEQVLYLVLGVLGAVATGFIAYRTALMAWTVVQAIATAAQWAWNLALDANPIGAIILGIAALIAAIVLLITHFDQVKRVVLDVWNAIGDKIGGVVNVIIAIFEVFVGAVQAVVNRIGVIFGAVVGIFANYIVAPIQHIIDFLAGAFTIAWQALGTFAGYIINGIATAFGAIVTAIQTVIGWIQQLISWFAKIPNLNLTPPDTSHGGTGNPFIHGAGGFFATPHVGVVGDVPEFVTNVPQMAAILHGVEARASAGGDTGGGAGGTVTQINHFHMHGTAAELLAQMQRLLDRNNQDIARLVEARRGS
jgi:TP901 family phage tail tape measure protein